MSKTMDFKKRQTSVQKILREKNIDAIIVENLINVRYLTGFDGSYGIAIIDQEKSLFITDGRYAEAAEEIVFGAEIQIQPIRDIDQYFEDIFKKRDYKKLAFESSISYHQFQQLNKRLKNCSTELVDETNLIKNLRMVKDEAEIAQIRKAAEIADQMMQTIWSEIKPGMTEREVSRRIRFLSEELGGSGESFTNIVASGVNSSRPHHHPGDSKLKDGDMITIDLGAVFEGYCSDMTRNPNLGKANSKYENIYNVCLEAQQSAVKACKAGMSGKELDSIARDIISSAGYGDHFQHGLGHGVGLEIHEGPRLSQSSKDTMEAGMVVTVEPGIYLPGFGGVRIEDLIVVTEDEPIVLSQTPLTLHIIDN